MVTYQGRGYKGFYHAVYGSRDDESLRNDISSIESGQSPQLHMNKDIFDLPSTHPSSSHPNLAIRNTML